MATEPASKPSFSRNRKWSIGLNLVVLVSVVLAVVIMANYLGGRHFTRWNLSPQTRTALAPRTVSLLKSFTNTVKVTLYYDKEDRFYPTIRGLLQEFQNVNPRILVAAIDPVRDLGDALKFKQAYNLGTATNRNFVIFDCESGGKQVVPGGLLVEYDVKRVKGEAELTFDRKATAFRGEMIFAASLLAVTSPKPLTAYFLKDHGEHLVTNGDDPTGYAKFAAVLEQNYVRSVPLSLTGTNTVPPDCNLLIVAGAIAAIPDAELEKIDQFLNQGGRLLAMFSVQAGERKIGLEKILERWGVAVGSGEVRDLSDVNRTDVVVSDFGRKPHPIVSPLVNLALHVLYPRPVGALPAKDGATEGPGVQEIAFSESAVLAGELVAGSTKKPTPRQFPLAVALERGMVKGVINQRGTTRIVVVGDSNFLGNQMIESAGNREFAHATANWLLDRPQILEGLGPQRIDEFRIVMSPSQARTIRWVLLAAMPGGIMLLGGLVWLRRRK